MIDITFDDSNLIKNVKAIQELKKSGLFTDEEIQILYNEQMRRDATERSE